MVVDLRQVKYMIPLLFCLSLAVFYFYDYLLRLLPSIVANGVMQAYQLSFFSFGEFCASYYLLYVPLQLVIGVVVDRYRFSYFLVVALLFCAAGCCFFANASSFSLALIGRMMMGFGAGFIFITVLKNLSSRLPSRYFTFYLGIILSVGMLGGFFMDSILILIVLHWGWRLLCYVLSFSGLLLALINYFWLYIHENIAIKCPSLRSGAFPMVKLSLQKDPRQAVLYERIDSTVSLHSDIQLMKCFLLNRRLLIQCFIGGLLYLPIAGFAESWGVHFLNRSHQLPHDFASFEMGLFFLGFAMGAPFLGWWYDQTRQYQLILTSATTAVTILLSIILYVPDLSIPNISIFLFLLGLFSSSLVIVLSLSRQMAFKHQLGKIFGIVNFFMMLAGGVTWLIGFAIDFSLTYTIIPYQLAFLILPIGSFIAVFLTFFA